MMAFNIFAMMVTNTNNEKFGARNMTRDKEIRTRDKEQGTRNKGQGI